MGVSNFKVNLKTLPQSPLDFNFICAAGYFEYKMLLAMTGALMLPFTLVHGAMQTAIAGFNNTTYKAIKSGMDSLNGAMKSILKTPIKDLKNISADIGAVGNALANSCEFFLSNLPDSLFNLFQDLQYGLLDIVNGLVKLPNAITNSIFKLLMDFKMQALKDVLGFAYDTFLSPLLALESFMQENGILTMLDQMHKMEVCMMKAGTCHRPAKDLTEPTSKKPWSQYYKSQFFLNNGKPNFNLMASNKTQAKQLGAVHSNLMGFLKF